MAGGESAAHRNLKRLALAWAQGNGFKIAATEVSVPTLGARRLDAAAYRPDFAPSKDPYSGRKVQLAQLGTTAVFECKASRADFLKDSRCERRITERLATLVALRASYEASMQQHFPTLRSGECLFPEFDIYTFSKAGFEPYDQIVREIEALTRRLHQQTKFDKLLRWKAANVHFVVVEPGIAREHELPAGWGLLVRTDDQLELRVKPIWQDAPEHGRWQLFLRIAMAGTRALNRAHDVENDLFSKVNANSRKPLFQ